MNSILIAFGIILAAHLSHQQLGTTYRAGVVEFQTRRVNSSTTNLANETQANANRIYALIISDAARALDILVFPESVLNYPATAVPVPNPSDNIVACSNQSNNALIQKFSCAAQAARTYVTLQLYMSTNCTVDRLEFNDTRPCTAPQNDTNIYNAAVVFDRRGAVIAVYRKFNVYNEPNVRKPLRADNITFTTDFNVTFGVFICFDILFDAPTNHLVERGIRHFVSPTLWNSELPYLTAIQVQQMWSYRQNVNLLVAGGNLPMEGISGSGIYSGKLGALIVEMTGTPTTRILISDLPRSPGTFDADTLNQQPQEQNFNAKIDDSSSRILPGLNIWREQMDNFNTRFLNFTQAAQQKDRICINNDNSVCCEYDIAVTDTGVTDNSTFYSYAIAVFNGHRAHGIGGTRRLNTRQMICSVVACTTFGVHESCGLRLPSNQTRRERFRFDRLILKADIVTAPAGQGRTLVMANTLDRNIRPLTSTDFQYRINSIGSTNNNQTAELRLLRPRNDVQTIAIYARNSLQDFYSRSDSKTIAVNGLLLLVLSTIITIFNQ